MMTMEDTGGDSPRLVQSSHSSDRIAGSLSLINFRQHVTEHAIDIHSQSYTAKMN